MALQQLQAIAKALRCSSKPSSIIYHKEVSQLKKTLPTWDHFFAAEEEVQRACGWVRLEVLGEPLIKKFAWAVPDEQALRIIGHFAPLVEMAAGRGYWAKLLRDRGVQLQAYDKYAKDLSGKWTEVLDGGPEVLSLRRQEEEVEERTLLLCYPDDSDCVAEKSLDLFRGEFVIHVGELVTTGTWAGGLQRPFGRTSSSSFPVALLEAFHCVLVKPLLSFPFAKDCLSVWKRTRFVPGRSVTLCEEEEEEEDGDSEVEGEGNVNSEEDNEGEANCDVWADIPREERLPLQCAAPAFLHLLSPSSS
eukprot:scaffold9796_cov154-Ochromonas_danica.AAC.10